MTALVKNLNESLVGFTNVIDLSLQIDHSSGAYRLKLTLADSTGKAITLTCQDVSSFRIAEFGGGLTQFLTLRAKDVRIQQLDKVTIHFADLERDAIAFNCSAAQITQS